MSISKHGFHSRLAKALKLKGLDIMTASKFSGISYSTIYQHCIGKREVSPRLAIIYEKLLKIPKSYLRPDIWPENNEVTQ